MALQIKEKLHDEQTQFQRIEIYETEFFGRLMTLDGLVMLTSRDNFIYHEMMTHPVLFTHSNPKVVVVVGGGDCGTLKEVLKHKEVRKAVQVEIDERVTRVAEKYFPELCEANNDPRATFVFRDAIQWMQECRENSLDVVILDTTDPVGQATRLFSPEFYGDCLRALRDCGILVAQSESPLFNTDLIQHIRKAMNEAGADDVMTIHFPQCTYPSGWWSATMARKGQKLQGFRETAARKKTFPTRYYNADIHFACQALPSYLLEELENMKREK
ncbi:MAG: polyamine aminopropyltransferase [Gammaproteobacteria bacterium]